VLLLLVYYIIVTSLYRPRSLLLGQYLFFVKEKVTQRN
jgi:hypothetical protein